MSDVLIVLLLITSAFLQMSINIGGRYHGSRLPVMFHHLRTAFMALVIFYGLGRRAPEWSGKAMVYQSISLIE